MIAYEKPPNIHHEAHEDHEENFRVKIKKISNHRLTQIKREWNHEFTRMDTNLEEGRFETRPYK